MSLSGRTAAQCHVTDSARITAPNLPVMKTQLGEKKRDHHGGVTNGGCQKRNEKWLRILEHMQCSVSGRSSKPWGWKQPLSGEFVSVLHVFVCVSVGLLFTVMIYLLKFMIMWTQMQSRHHYMGKDKWSSWCKPHLNFTLLSLCCCVLDVLYAQSSQHEKV